MRSLSCSAPTALHAAVTAQAAPAISELDGPACAAPCCGGGGCGCCGVGERRGEAALGAGHAGEPAGGSAPLPAAVALVAAVGGAAWPGADCGGGSPWRKGQPPGTPGAVAACLGLGSGVGVGLGLGLGWRLPSERQR